jgi:hypothetical protein
MRVLILIIFGIFFLPFLANASPTLWNLDADDNIFIGREKILAEINENLNNAGNKHKTKTLLLVGNKGVGKAKIAAQYARTNNEKYRIIWWFEHNDSMKSQFKQLANELNRKFFNGIDKESLLQGDVVNNVKDYLRITSTPWLLIFNNVLANNTINKFLPEKHSASDKHVVLTSIFRMEEYKNIEVPFFSNQEAYGLLYEILGSQDQQAIQTVVKSLDNFPLAIKLAGDALEKKSSLTLEEFTSLDVKKQQELSNLSIACNAIGYVTSKVKEESRKAYELLNFISTLNNENIPDKLLEEWFLKSEKNNKIDYIKAKKILMKYLLLIPIEHSNNENSKIYFIHKIIKNCIGSKLPISKKKAIANQTVDIYVQLLLGNNKNVFAKSFYDYFEQILTLFDVAKSLSINSQNLFLLYSNVFEYFQIVERDPKKARLFIEKIEPYIDKKGPSIAHAKFYINLASLNAWFGDFKKSMLFCESALEIYKKDCCSPNEVIRAKFLILQCYLLSGQTAKARKMLNDIYEKYFYAANNEKIEHYMDGYYYYTKSFVLLEEGKLELSFAASLKALNSINEIMRTYHSPEKYFSRYLYARLNNAEISFFLGNSRNKLDELTDIYEKSFLNCKNDRFTGYLKSLLGHALAENGQFKKGLEEVEEGIGLLDGWYEGKYKHREQGVSHIMAADILFKIRKYKASLDHLLFAEKVFNHCYITYEADIISLLYSKIFKVAHKMGEDTLVYKYLSLQAKHFGREHHRTKIMLESLL